MKRTVHAETVLRAYFKERLREEQADREQRLARPIPMPATLTETVRAASSPTASAPTASSPNNALKAAGRLPVQGSSRHEALKSVFLAAACLALLASVTLSAPRQSYDAGALHSAALQLKVQADKIGLFSPFIPLNVQTGGTQ